ncbi:MAG TPA: hypothetical protein VHX44_03505 [Planctomycetota bacterium]|nr:hypothetical protein [Planctomycetota bacterium]
MALAATTVAANLVLAGPTTGGATTGSFRALVATDIPNLDTSKLTSGTLGVARGGTGLASFTSGDLPYASGTTTISKLGIGSSGTFLKSNGSVPAWASITISDISSGTLAAANGGTGIASYAVGDILYASAGTTLSKLADVATGNALISGGVTTAPSWGKIGLTTHVSGILPSANGGTGVNNAGTITCATNLTVTGGGTIALGGFTLTVLATGTVGLLGTSNTWSASNLFKKASGTDNIVLDTTGAGQQAGFNFADNGTNKWAFYKEADQTFKLYDYANAVNPLRFVQGAINACYTNFLSTLAASSSVSGAVVVGDAATAATNVAIGGGVIYAGTQIQASTTGNVLNSMQINAVTAGTQCGLNYSDAGTSKWSLYKHTDNTLRLFDQVNGIDILAVNQGSISAGFVKLFYTKAASSSTTGAIVIGDQSTASTNVAIGGGKIFTGDLISSTGGIEVTGGNFAAGKLYAGPTLGTILSCRTGTLYDFYLSDTAGNSVALVPTGSRIFVVANGISSTSTTTGGLQVVGGIGTTGSIYAGAGILSVSPSAGNGYATGAGGTVTQITSKATSVTLNKICGQITMQAAALAAGAKVSFVVSNTSCSATDIPSVAVVSGGTANAYRASVAAVAANSFTITVENITAGSLSEAPVIGFQITKAVTS